MSDSDSEPENLDEVVIKEEEESEVDEKEEGDDDDDKDDNMDVGGSDSDEDDDKKDIKPEITEDSSKVVKKKGPKPGIIYLSKIPPKMNVKMIREYFANFGEINRSFLQPESKLYFINK